MDDQSKNLIIATALSFLVILGWFFLFPPEPKPATAPTQTAQPDGSPSWTPSEWRFSVCERANRWIGRCNTATGVAFA